MRSLAIMVGCALLGWLAKRREHHPSDEDLQRQRALQVRANLQRFLTELYADIEVEVCDSGVFIKSSDPTTVIEILTHNPAFYARVA